MPCCSFVVLTVSPSPGLQDAVFLLGAEHQGVWVGVQHVVLDVIQVERGQLCPTHHAEQAARLRLILHEELLAEPGVQRVVQVALQRQRRRSRMFLLLLSTLERLTVHRAWGQRLLGLLQRHNGI